VFYCSKDCQVAHSHIHNGECTVHLAQKVSNMRSMKYVMRQSHLSASERKGQLADTIYQLGCIHTQNAEFLHASVCFQEVIEIYEFVYGDQDGRVGDACNRLGIAYQGLRRYEEAEIMHRRDLKIYTKVDKNDINVMRARANIDACLKGTGGKREDFGVVETSAVGKKLNASSVLCDLARSQRKEGNFSEAEANMQKAITIAKDDVTTDGIEHLAGLHESMGAVYAEKKSYEAAEEEYETALDKYRSINKEKHPNVASVFYSLGCMYSRQGDFRRALRVLKKSLKITTAIDPSNSVGIARSKMSIGNVYHKQENFQEALTIYSEVLEVFIAEGQATHDLAKAHVVIGNCKGDMGDYKGSLKSYKRANKVCEKNLLALDPTSTEKLRGKIDAMKAWCT
jgi:tetratricopeptide (TPR) repeat protein